MGILILGRGTAPGKPQMMSVASSSPGTCADTGNGSQNPNFGMLASSSAHLLHPRSTRSDRAHFRVSRRASQCTSSLLACNPASARARIHCAPAEAECLRCARTPLACIPDSLPPAPCGTSNTLTLQRRHRSAVARGYYVRPDAGKDGGRYPPVAAGLHWDVDVRKDTCVVQDARYGLQTVEDEGLRTAADSSHQQDAGSTAPDSEGFAQCPGWPHPEAAAIGCIHRLLNMGCRLPPSP